MAPSGRVDSTPQGSTQPMRWYSSSLNGRLRLALSSIGNVPLSRMPTRGRKAFRQTSTCFASMLPPGPVTRRRPPPRRSRPAISVPSNRVTLSGRVSSRPFTYFAGCSRALPLPHQIAAL
ncbi:hypothetical protein D3C81_1696600 [compost metagenome]